MEVHTLQYTFPYVERHFIQCWLFLFYHNNLQNLEYLCDVYSIKLWCYLLESVYRYHHFVYLSYFHIYVHELHEILINDRLTYLRSWCKCGQWDVRRNFGFGMNVDIDRALSGREVIKRSRRSA